MPYREKYHAVSENEVKAWLGSNEDTIWVGALSFEERCLASLRSLVNLKACPKRSLVLNYPTKVHPTAEDRSRRKENWRKMMSLGGASWAKDASIVDVDPYSFQQLQESLLANLTNSPARTVVFDITCMTKIHALALAALLTRHGVSSIKSAFAYSIPENYTNIDSDTGSPGWRDVIIAPLAETAILLYEAHSRGVVIPGHDADRLIVALSELDPSGGSVVMANTPKRPDLLQQGRRMNRKVVSYLCRPSSGQWTQEMIKIDDIVAIGNCLDSEIERARKHKAPVILFPYGPKSLIFFAAIQLCHHYPEAGWFVYPVPTWYDVGYTEGIEKTFWFVPTTN